MAVIAMLSLRLLLLLLLSLHPLAAVTEHSALLSFKSLLSDPTAALSSWNSSSPNPCSWHQVKCNPSNHVTYLNVSSLRLAGAISSCLSLLPHLRELDLSNNHFTGPIPTTFSNLSSLRILDLSSNSLSGPIPPSLSLISSLTSISLGYNQLTGAIPNSLSLLPHLHELDLSNNYFTGPIPTTFSNLSSLQILDLSSNYLSGPIPPSLSLIPSLTSLSLGYNQLTGAIPDSLSLLPLTRLRLSVNNLTGEVPSWLGHSSTLLRIYLSSNFLTGTVPSTFCANSSSPLFFLDLSRNSLVGTIPQTLGNCSGLSYLILTQNKLTGTVPSIIGRLPLQTLDISFNDLHGVVPRSIYNISSMIYLSMAKNRLEGVLPDDIGLRMPLMQALVMHGNQLHGPIPSSLANATWLYVLDLSTNLFSGKIEVQLGGLQMLYDVSLATNRLVAGDWSFLESLTNCSRLRFLILSQNLLGGNIPAWVGDLSRTTEWLELDDNGMTGTIPWKLGNLFNLTLLDLSSNNFYGKIPSIIGNFKVLQLLNLSHNNFSGQIPPSISKLVSLSELYLDSNSFNGFIPPSLGLNKQLTIVNLSHNQLTGNIPKELVSISSLSRALDLSYNYLSGSIPTEIKGLINLFLLDLSHNQITGKIPSSIGACVELQYLYMQYNNLSGGIPKALTELTLNYLDLSFNDLDGEILVNGVFSNSSAVSLIGNDNLCGGDPVLLLPACPIVPKHKHHKSHILKLIIIIIASTALLLSMIVMVTLYVTFCLKRRKRSIVASSKPAPATTSIEDKYIKVSYNDLYKATNGFSPEALIGTGGYGSVYKGRINGYKKGVAVKVLDLDHHGAMKSFTAECDVLRSVRHRNLVKNVTSCSTIDARGSDFRALVFEFMPNGSLEEWLHGERGWLGLNERMEVAIDVGVALRYLHEQGETPIVHCDLKPSNVLLDEDMNARVGDFGLARFLKGGIKVPIEGFSESAAVKGSVGYVAPEYGMGEELSIRGDVYSYGILLLEMLTRRRPTDPTLEEGVVLRQYVEAAYPKRVMEIVDQTLLPWETDGDIDFVLNESYTRLSVVQCLISLFRVGLLCSKERATERMYMRDVVSEMQAIRATYMEGFQKEI